MKDGKKCEKSKYSELILFYDEIICDITFD